MFKIISNCKICHNLANNEIKNIKFCRNCVSENEDKIQLIEELDLSEDLYTLTDNFEIVKNVENLKNESK